MTYFVQAEGNTACSPHGSPTTNQMQAACSTAVHPIQGRGCTWGILVSGITYPESAASTQRLCKPTTKLSRHDYISTNWRILHMWIIIILGNYIDVLLLTPFSFSFSFFSILVLSFLSFLTYPRAAYLSHMPQSTVVVCTYVPRPNYCTQVCSVGLSSTQLILLGRSPLWPHTHIYIQDLITKMRLDFLKGWVETGVMRLQVWARFQGNRKDYLYDSRKTWRRRFALTGL